jgi:LmbE family N-acetylglucosaminyl deacetylase
MDVLSGLFNRTLVIAPHPDDECFVYGVVSKIQRAGCDVRVIVAAAADRYQPHAGRVVTAEERIQELQNSASALELPPIPVRFIDWDGRMDALPLGEVIAWIEEAVSRFGPTGVLLPVPSHHQDHRVVFEAALAALRPMSNQSVRLIAAYEYPFSVVWPAPYQTTAMSRMVIAISEADLERKLAALEEHRSQLHGRPNNHPLHQASVRKLAAVRGLEIGVDYAEVIYPLRIVI